MTISLVIEWSDFSWPITWSKGKTKIQGHVLDRYETKAGCVIRVFGFENQLFWKFWGFWIKFCPRLKSFSFCQHRLKYKTLFGGVEGFWVEHYRRINGFPNRFWGWGGEDDDLYVRFVKRKKIIFKQHIVILKFISSAHAPLNRNDGGLLPDAYLHLVRKKDS